MTVRGCQSCRDCQPDRPRTALVIAWVNDHVSPELERITLVAELREWIAANTKPWDRSDTFNFQSNIPSPTLALHDSAEWMAWFEAFAEAKRGHAGNARRSGSGCPSGQGEFPAATAPVRIG